MKIAEAKYSGCKSCGHRKYVSADKFGCDTCKKPITTGSLSPKGHHQFLQANVFPKEGGGSTSMEFCSWKCCLKGLAKVECDHFISVPYLLYDEEQKGIRAEDFFAAVKAFK